MKGDPMVRQGHFRAFRRHWWIILASAACALGIGVVVTALTPATYVSTVTFFATTPSSEIAGAFQGDQFGQRRVDSYVKLFHSELLAQKIIDDTRLDMPVSEVMSELSAVADPNTVVLVGSVTDTSGARSLAIAQSAATQFVALVTSVETPAGSAAPTVNLQVTTGPTLNPDPILPRSALNYVMALLAGIAAGMILCLVRDRFDLSVRSADALHELTELPVVGVIPHESSARNRPVAADPSTRESVLTECFRQLRGTLGARYVESVGVHARQEVRGVGDPGIVLAVTSCVAEEGRTTTAANLAVSFAAAGRQVLLIDGDLRRPAIRGYFGLAASAGLDDVLRGHVSAEHAIHPHVRRNLSVLPGGSPISDPGELVGGRHCADLLAALRHRFDLIVVDTPALLAAADGAVVASLAEATVLVVRYGRTTRPQIMRGIDVLTGVNAHVYGSVLNMCPVKGVDGYGFQYNHYHEVVVGTSGATHEAAGRVAAPSEHAQARGIAGSARHR
jgi:capsular exopolysaccharide synthesis family protein